MQNLQQKFSDNLLISGWTKYERVDSQVTLYNVYPLLDGLKKILKKIPTSPGTTAPLAAES